MSLAIGDANSANIQILQQLNRDFQTTQRRVATGVSVFSAIDDSVRYQLSSRLVARSQLLNAVNNNISTVLKTLEATDHTIRSMVSLVDQAIEIANRALARGTPGFQGARSTTDINANTLVSPLAVPGSRFTIVTDGGQRFTYTFGAAAASTRWGEIVDALNAANIGVIAEYAPATAPSINNLRFRSLNGRDFRFGGDSDQQVIASLGAITSGTGGALNLANQFVLGAAAPTASNTGFTISFGGAIQTAVNVTAATALTAGSSLTFRGSDRTYHTWTTGTTASTIGAAIAGINGMNVGIVAELVNTGAGTTALRLRNADGEDFELVSAVGAFGLPTGLARFDTAAPFPQTAFKAALRADHAFRLMFGMQYDSIVANLALLARNNPVPEGNNLLRGDRINVVTGELSSALLIEGRDVTTAASLGLMQAGSTWTTVTNLEASLQQAMAARSNLIDLAGQIGLPQALLSSRHAINRNFSTELGELGTDLISADMSDETARLAAMSTQQQFAVDAFSRGTAYRELITQLIE